MDRWIDEWTDGLMNGQMILTCSSLESGGLFSFIVSKSPPLAF